MASAQEAGQGGVGGNRGQRVADRVAGGVAGVSRAAGGAVGQQVADENLQAAGIVVAGGVVDHLQEQLAVAGGSIGHAGVGRGEGAQSQYSGNR